MSFALTILGSSSALPTSQRFTTAHVLNVHERFFLIDCGEGTQIQLRRNNIPLGKINHIFISHLHGDHFFGLFGLISTFNLLGHKSTLHIYSHPDLKQIMNWQLNPNSMNIHIGDDREDLENEDFSFKIVFHPLDYTGSQLIYEDNLLTVHSFPLKHRIPVCGFIFKEKPKPYNIKKEVIEFYKIPVADIVKIKAGADFTTSKGELIKNERLTLPPYRQRSYAFCSDTSYTESIIPIVEGCDILYHEATYLHDLAHQAKLTCHTTAHQAATLANKACVKRLIIGHFSSRYKDADALVIEAKAVFESTEAAIDGTTYTVEQERKEILAQPAECQ